MITIVNYKMGNIRSVQNALDYLGMSYQVSSDPKTISEAEKLILPGVGSFRQAMANLNQMNLVEPLHEVVKFKERPVLGICLGMQLFAEEGTEDGLTQGLGWISGKVIKFNFENRSIRVPHIGFNTVHYVGKNNDLYRNLGESGDFYFVHSYHMVSAQNEEVSGWGDYCGRFVSSIQKEHIFGTQYHPEKSQSNGLTVLKNFTEFK